MKAKHIIGCLMLAGACLSCSSDKEDALIIITDKGQGIDDDKTLQTPGEQKPVKPGDIGDIPINPDTIPNIGGEDAPLPPALNTLYITDHQTDTTLFAGNSDTINSHIIIKANGSLNVLKDHTMHNDATITIESGGYMYVGGCLKQVDLTIEPEGTLELDFRGSIILKSIESLHLTAGFILTCTGNDEESDSPTGNVPNYDGWNIYAPGSFTDPTSSKLEKLDSLDIQELVKY